MTASISAAFVHRVEAPRRAAELRAILDAVEQIERRLDELERALRPDGPR
jgi:ubiquinone biosynthesis protein UbiJ